MLFGCLACFQGLVWTTCLSTAILLYKDVWPSEAALYSFPRTSLNIAAFFCPAASTSLVDSAQIQAQLALISPSFVVGVAFACCGGLLRVVSSRTLGYMYNSSLELRPAHRLVTSGPYAYVRHPGYTGALLGIVGISLVNFAPGSWIRECGLLEESITAASSRWILWTWVFLNIGRFVALSFSAATEDGVLGRKFGLEWKSWSWKVPKWFIPGLF